MKNNNRDQKSTINNHSFQSTSSKRQVGERSSIEEDPDYAAVPAGESYGTMRDVGEVSHLSIHFEMTWTRVQE